MSPPLAHLLEGTVGGTAMYSSDATSQIFVWCTVMSVTLCDICKAQVRSVFPIHTISPGLIRDKGGLESLQS